MISGTFGVSALLMLLTAALFATDGCRRWARPPRGW